MENAIEFYGNEEVATVTFSRTRFQNRVLYLSEKYPDRVEIVKKPEENSGYLLARIPVDWVRIRPPKQVSEEAKERLREMSKQYGKGR